MFNFLRNHHTVIHSNYPVLNSQKQLKRVPISTSSLPLVISWFFIVAALMGERWSGLSNKSQIHGVLCSEAQSAPQFLYYWGPVFFLPMPFCPETTMRSPHTTMKSNPHSPQLEKACTQQWRPNTTKKTKFKKNFKRTYLRASSLRAPLTSWLLYPGQMAPPLWTFSSSTKQWLSTAGFHPPFLGVPSPQIQPTANQKVFFLIPEISKRQHHLHCIYNYLYSIYLILGMISNLEMT